MSQRADLVTDVNSSAGRGSLGAELPPRAPATPLEAFAAVVAALLPVAISPAVYSYTFTPKLAVLLVVAAVGVPRLLRLALGGQHAGAARAALVFLVVALAATADSGSVLLGLFGSYEWGTGWLFWCGALGAWAIGASLGARGRELAASGLLLGASANALVTIAQEALRLRSPVLGLYQGAQADGLMGNPIFLESILVGALAIALSRAHRGHPAWLGVAALLSAGLELGGERLAVALLAVLVLCGLVVYHSRRAVAFAVAVAVGYGLAYLSTSRLLHQRLQQGVTSSPRTALWRTLLHALAHHPLLGFGPGGTLAASTAYQPLSLARRLAVGTYFTDAHDVVLEVAVTTGLLGLAALAVFAMLALRRARGALLGFAVLAAAVELVEPLNVGVTPLVLLALGAAVSNGRQLPARPGRVELGVRSGLAALAVVAAGVMLVGDFELNEGYLHYDYAQTARGAQLLPVWSQPAATAALVAANRSLVLHDQSHWRLETRRWWATAASREPTNTEVWANLAESDVTEGDLRRATVEYDRSLVLDRYDTGALLGLGRLELRLGHRAQAVALYRRAVASAPGDAEAAQVLSAATSQR